MKINIYTGDINFQVIIIMIQSTKKYTFYIAHIFFILFLFFLLGSFPLEAQKFELKNKFKFVFGTENVFYTPHHTEFPKKHALGFDISYSSKSTSSQLELTRMNNKFILDGSYLSYTKGISTIGVGAINRHWSYSPRTSLILSSNARPFSSIFLEFKSNNQSTLPIFSSLGPWSLEAFNGLTDLDRGPNNSMLFGVRATIKPIEKLELELLQTTQWGGDDYENDFSGLTKAIFGNTNEGVDSHINRMAGIGFLYVPIKKINSLRLYGQAIGEDESGGFPSCYMNLLGLEWMNNEAVMPYKIMLETVDTRINETTTGYCGVNTAYNNGIYSYANKGRVMGTSIDTESTSLELAMTLEIKKPLILEYSIKEFVINDGNWSSHRLSSTRQTGLVNSINLSWQKYRSDINLGVYHQDLYLNKSGIKNSFGLIISSSLEF
jgi:hypothetical protein